MILPRSVDPNLIPPAASADDPFALHTVTPLPRERSQEVTLLDRPLPEDALTLHLVNPIGHLGILLRAVSIPSNLRLAPAFFA